MLKNILNKSENFTGVYTDVFMWTSPTDHLTFLSNGMFEI